MIKTPNDDKRYCHFTTLYNIFLSLLGGRRRVGLISDGGCIDSPGGGIEREGWGQQSQPGGDDRTSASLVPAHSPTSEGGTMTTAGMERAAPLEPAPLPYTPG